MKKNHTLELRIPDSLLIALNQNSDEFFAEMRFTHACQLYKGAKLTLSQAAELAGMSKWEMAETLSHKKHPVIDYSPDELEDEVIFFSQKKIT